jgi:xanthine dehydrogenase YagS FAD-binding subunit
LKGGAVSDARVVLGHVAPIPWLAAGAGSALIKTAVGETTAAKCGDAAAQGAKPLSGNAYKVQMVKTAVKRAVLAAAAT